MVTLPKTDLRPANSTPTVEPIAAEIEVSGRRILLMGGVQGHGVRPAIARIASEFGVMGSVMNTPQGVEIEAEGPSSSLEAFERALPATLPVAARLSRSVGTSITPSGADKFTIVRDSAEGPLATHVPNDLAICPKCSREVNRPGDRRYRYPFTSCTECGPRYSVIRAMPFERPDTAMAAFPLCVDCRHEYERPRDRRFHAQTMACPVCGPRIWSRLSSSNDLRYGDRALQEAAEYLLAGKIVALRGLGGYQLLVDATNQSAVHRLRGRKARPAKPLAVMVASQANAQQLAWMDADEIAALEDAAGPIVLLRARAKSGLAAEVHPNLDTVGLMRPTTPLHAMIAQQCGRPLVCTSGNREGGPLEFEVEAADHRLAELCDLLLHHDRPIIHPIDDSVVRVIAGRRVTIRLARGLAPLALELPPLCPAMALGGYMKAAVAWSNRNQVVLGPHISDQESLQARERYLSHLDAVECLYRFRPELLVHDLHPEYFSTQWANKQRVATFAVQHHHAHIAAGMLEHNWLNQKVLGIAWDGTGYGTDSTIWGGEFLVCTGKSFERVARLRPFRLPGGEAAIREPWRIAVSIYAQLESSENVKRWDAWHVGSQQIESVSRIVNRPQLAPLTSSAGRLIDAAAALILGIDHVDFDGEAAMRLEASADRAAKGWYEFPLTEGELLELDWRPLFAGLLNDHRRGVDPGVMAMRFHRTLAHGITRVCRHWREMPVILSGGVFQNRLLTELIVEMHNDHVQSLGLPEIIPPNDGGLAAGQLVVAAAQGGYIPCA